MIIPRSARSLNFLLCLGCIAMLGAAYVMEYGFNMAPCKLCMFQRVVFMAIVIVSMLTALINPRKIGRIFWGLLLIILTSIGIALSLRHLYLQSLPPELVPDCGPPLDYMMDILPLSEVIVSVLNGSGDCAEVSWVFLGLTIPGWTLVAFIGILLFTIYANFIAPRDPA